MNCLIAPPNVILSADPALNPDNYAVLTVFLSLKGDKVIGLALDYHMSSLTLFLTKAKSSMHLEVLLDRLCRLTLTHCTCWLREILQHNLIVCSKTKTIIKAEHIS